MTKPKPVAKYSPEWFQFYAVAWQARWPALRDGGGVHGKGGAFIWTHEPGPVAIMAAQDADEAIAAFNAAFCKEAP